MDDVDQLGPHPLCCCEYLDVNRQRNHILFCCCNCIDLDEGFDSLIRGEGFPRTNRSNFMTIVQDRMRFPWRGGARQVAFDAILPVILLPVMFLLAATSFWWTVFSFTAIFVILVAISRFFVQAIPNTKFFFVWTATSIVILYVIFEFVVIPLLQILVEENLTLSLFIALFILCVCLLKNRTVDMKDCELESGLIGQAHRCSICQIVVPGRDHHFVWFDCCIGYHNRRYFILALFFGIAALLYSSNLTLTSVCHPFVFYKTILLPDDCSDVYQQFELGLSFVAALYSIGLALLLLIIFLHQILLISLGLTSREWKNLTFLSKLRLGLCSNRPHNHGFIRNWMNVLCINRYR